MVVVYLLTLLLALLPFIPKKWNVSKSTIRLISITSFVVIAFFSILNYINEDRADQNLNTNVDSLKLDARSILGVADNQLSKLEIITDSIVLINGRLQYVKDTLSQQINQFQTTTDQIRAFEKLVRDRMELEKQAIELNIPILKLRTSKIELAIDDEVWKLSFVVFNSGMRAAYDFNITSALLSVPDIQDSIINGKFKLIDVKVATGLGSIAPNSKEFRNVGYQVKNLPDIYNDPSLLKIVAVKLFYHDLMTDKRDSYFYAFRSKDGREFYDAISPLPIDHYVEEFLVQQEDLLFRAPSLRYFGAMTTKQRDSLLLIKQGN